MINACKKVIRGFNNNCDSLIVVIDRKTKLQSVILMIADMIMIIDSKSWYKLRIAGCK